MSLDESEELDPIPPTPERVAKRALILSAVACRGAIEREAGDENAEAFRGRVLDWVKDLDLCEEIETGELELLDLPLGNLPKQVEVNASWRAEGLAVLAWALKRMDLPPHDQMADPSAIAESLGFLRDGASTVLESPQMRSGEDIARLGEMMFALHWRLRDYSLNHKALDFIEFAKTCWFGPLEINGLRCIENDLAIGDIPIGRSDERSWRTCLSIAQERHLAANWLRGDEQIYSDVSTDT
jgi:uncharacterized protein DUF4272